MFTVREGQKKRIEEKGMILVFFHFKYLIAIAIGIFPPSDKKQIQRVSTL